MCPKCKSRERVKFLDIKRQDVVPRPDSPAINPEGKFTEIGRGIWFYVDENGPPLSSVFFCSNCGYELGRHG